MAEHFRQLLSTNSMVNEISYAEPCIATPELDGQFILDELQYAMVQAKYNKSVPGPDLIGYEFYLQICINRLPQ